MQRNHPKLGRGGTVLAAPACFRPRGFPAHKERDGFILTGGPHQAKKIVRRINCCILDFLNDIARCDTLTVGLGLVVNRHDHYAVRIPEGKALARRVGDGRQQHPEIR